MKKILLVLLPFLFVACKSNNHEVFQSLNQGWNLATDTLDINLQVNLPSEAHADLYAAGLIPHP